MKTSGRTFIAVPMQFGPVLIAYTDTMADATALNGTARTHTNLPDDAADTFPAAAQKALDCALS